MKNLHPVYDMTTENTRIVIITRDVTLVTYITSFVLLLNVWVPSPSWGISKFVCSYVGM